MDRDAPLIKKMLAQAESIVESKQQQGWTKQDFANALSHHFAIEALDEFTKAYIACALWSSTDDDVPLDTNYDIDDIALRTLERMKTDCAAFQRENGPLIVAANYLSKLSHGSTHEGMAGHDFWLTRNHHGAGFWDGDWSEPAAKILTTSCHEFGEINLYVGDDGKLHTDDCG